MGVIPNNQPAYFSSLIFLCTLLCNIPRTFYSQMYCKSLLLNGQIPPPLGTEQQSSIPQVQIVEQKNRRNSNRRKINYWNSWCSFSCAVSLKVGPFVEMRCRPISGVMGELKPTSVAAQMPHSPFIEIFKMFRSSDSIAHVRHEWLDQECIDRTGARPPTQLQQLQPNRRIS